MAVEIINPNGDGTTLELTSTGGAHWDNILVDAAYRQPSSHFLLLTTPANFEGGGVAYTDEYLMESLADVASVSSVKVWVWIGVGGGGETCEVSAYLGGSYQTPISNSAPGSTWTSYEFTGDWTQGDLDALKIKITLSSDYGSALLAMYAEVTYIKTGEPSGGSIARDGAYLVHTFDSSGTFNTAGRTLNCQLLVIAGGGGGAGGAGAGGGGGGGMLEKASHSASGSIAVTVGAGGAGGSGAFGSGASGGNSSFGAITALGGGGGGNSELSTASGFDGGSGGGAGGAVSGGTSGAHTQADSGGATAYASDGGASTTHGVGAGGGGAGGSGSSSGTGGSARNNSITGSSVAYAHGGAGTQSTPDGSSGTANHGHGGAGGGTSTSGGSGGSGVVIVRYLSPLNTLSRRGCGLRIGSRQPYFS